MNKMSNSTFEYDNSFDALMERKKTLTGMQPESLYSMAMYDVETIVNQEMAQPAPPAFYPVDEYKDLTLKEILDISDDFLFGSDDSLMDGISPSASGAPVPEGPVSSGPVQHEFSASMPPQPVPQAVLSGGEPNAKKRQREEDFDDEDDEERRFRPYQSGQWVDKFAELCTYREKNGHCLVPHTFSENLPLARWVKRQRYQYKLMQDGKPSTMTEERVQALEDVGFVWDSQRAAWEERLGELKEFFRTFLHCNVPSNYNENPQLATWVKCQRRQYKLHCQGKPSNMTDKRINQLVSLGFEWELRSYKKA